jgi:lysophospholipid acyltransferase (LPLAT)-like uncharacterized protein
MNEKPDYSDVEMRRSKRSGRRMSLGRRTAYALGKPLLRFLLFVLTATYRFEKVIGSDVADKVVADRDRSYVPVYWHGHQIPGSHLIRDWIRRGFKAGFVISASVDGEVPAAIAKAWGAEVIRGSAQETGALVLRDAVEMMKRGVSIVTMSDGPLGPKHQIKTGTVLVARMGDAPLVPIACAASRAWTTNTWDSFIIPKPFARIVIAVGEPIEVPRGLPANGLEDKRDEMQAAMEALLEEAEAAAAR